MRGTNVRKCWPPRRQPQLLAHDGLREPRLDQAGIERGRLLERLQRPVPGGLLDRIDALLFVAPWIYVCAAYLPRVL